jgi:uncharacterized protein
MRLAIISDTHMPKGARALPAACVERLRSSDLILHAGDLSTLAVLREIEALGPPVLAVHGNVDDARARHTLPPTRIVDLPSGVKLAMVHDAGPAAGRLARMRRAFPGAAAVVFGHSHIPLHEADPDGGFQIFNPGSPTERRRQPRHTMGEALVEAGAIAFTRVDLDP